MFLIIGIVIVLGSVAGGYVLSHGNLAALWQPYELIIIGGAAFGAFVISNPVKVVKQVFGSIPTLLSGSKFDKPFYMDLLSLLHDIFAKARKEGMMAIEADLEEPDKSELFNRYPKIAKDHHIINFITDYLRLIVGGNMNPFELENLMDVEIETHHHEAEQPAQALNKVADGLPGFGIVAAVLGIVITMGFISESAEAIGAHVAAALVGTFLGILLAYGFVGPMGNALEHRVAEESKVYECIKVSLLATVNGYSPQIAVEFGRKVLYSTVRPGFQELEEHLRGQRG